MTHKKGSDGAQLPKDKMSNHFAELAPEEPAPRLTASETSKKKSTASSATPGAARVPAFGSYKRDAPGGTVSDDSHEHSKQSSAVHLNKAAAGKSSKAKLERPELMADEEPVARVSVKASKATTDEETRKSALLEKKLGKRAGKSKELSHSTALSGSSTTEEEPMNQNGAELDGPSTVHNFRISYPGAQRVDGIYSNNDWDDTLDDIDTEDPELLATKHVLPSAQPVMDHDEDAERPVHIQEALRESDEHEINKDTGLWGWMETHKVLVIIVTLLVLGGVVGGIVGGVAASGSSSTSMPEVPSPAPSSLAYADLLAIVSSLTPPSDIADETTPQHSAFKWMVDVDDIDIANENKTIQRYSLATLYFATGGQNWTSQANFLSSGLDECQWTDASSRGVAACNDDGMVTELFLADHNLQGSIPSEIKGLGMLQYLYLAKNQLSGRLPTDLFLLTDLLDLRLFLNQLTGPLPQNIGNLHKIEDLRFHSNMLSGSIPTSIGGLTSLGTLIMGDNRISGLVPKTMGQLSNLRVWFNENNLMSGQVPSEVSGMNSLTTLYLNGNAFSGTMEPFCVNATRLNEFLSDCFQSDLTQQPPEVQCSCCTGCCEDGRGCSSA